MIGEDRPTYRLYGIHVWQWRLSLRIIFLRSAFRLRRFFTEAPGRGKQDSTGKQTGGPSYCQYKNVRPSRPSDVSVRQFLSDYSEMQQNAHWLSIGQVCAACMFRVGE